MGSKVVLEGSPRHFSEFLSIFGGFQRSYAGFLEGFGKSRVESGDLRGILGSFRELSTGFRGVT